LSGRWRHTLGAPFAPNARLLKRAKRNGQIGAKRIVSDGARAQLARNRIGTLDIVREYRRIEAIHRIIGDLNGSRFALGGNNAQHGPENLFTRNRRVIVDVSENRRFDKEPAIEAGRTLATRRERGTFGATLRDIPFNAITLAATPNASPMPGRCLCPRVAAAIYTETV